MKLILALIAISIAIIGMAAGQYPYYGGYYGMANPYWQANYYASSFPGENANYNYYQVWNPGGGYYGEALYDESGHMWAFRGQNGDYGEGYSQQDPYHDWPTGRTWW
jgi:hypothetical protein